MADAVKKASPLEKLVSDVVAEAKKQVNDANAKNKERVKGTTFGAPAVKPDKYVDAAIQTRKDAILAAVTQVAMDEF